MSVIGITGGIATGKSTLCELLRELLPSAVFFNADVAAREFTDSDTAVQEELRQAFGPEIFSSEGDLNRAALRAMVFGDAARKAALEQILHPRIRQRWRSEAEHSRQSGKLFLADIPLLFETGGETLCDRVVVVACTPEVQRSRLQSRTGLAAAEVEQMIDAQMPLTQKIERANHVVWNNGGRESLGAQARILANLFEQRNG